MTRKYSLKATPANHPIKARPFFHEIRDELAQIAVPAIADLERIETELLHRKTHPTPDPVPVPTPAPPTEPEDMRPLLQAVRDQGDQGSCFAFAGTAAQALCEASLIIPGAPLPDVYAPADLSWNTRALMGTTDQDSGGNLGDAITAQEQTGTCLEALMTYDAAVFATAPSAEAVIDQAQHKAKFKAYPIDLSDSANLGHALADGYPVYMGFNVPQSFENCPASGVLSDPTGETTLGGHAGLLYSDPTCPAGSLAEQNSWGTSWGNGGRCQMPIAGYLPLFIEAYALVPTA